MSRKKRAPNRLKYGEDIKRLYRLFIKPVLAQFEYKDNEYTMAEGLRWFFGIGFRHVYFARATEAFTVRNCRWESLSCPTVVDESGRRNVHKGQPLVVRWDDRTPNKVEIETDVRIYVLTKAEWLAIKEYVELVA